MKTVKEIIKNYLKENGYHGLCTEDCVCDIDDLFRCDGNFENCEPAYRKYCDCDVCAACGYASCGDWRKVIYWMAAATLTAVVTW